MVDAVVLAGSPNNGPLKECSPVPYEALIPIGDKSMVRYVVDALTQSRSIARIAVVGPREELSVDLQGTGALVVPAGGSLLENVQGGMEALSGARRVLLVSSDIPLITPGAIEDFLEQCRDQRADLYYPIVPREAVESRFKSGVQRTYVSLKEGVFTGGNIFLLNPEVVSRCLPLGQQLVDARKSPLRLCRLVGLGFLLRFLLHRVTLKEAEARVSRLLGVQGCVVISRYPEVGVDVDKPVDLALVTRALQSAC
ncbi:NTP transferase domain-containing protein [Desulfofundulus thermobenzoicus]|uniref:NTP transferase domain-containing protein n=1 Tax=Desulfofundulus thermobenzoicus TaxID=29376 RepID=A0A6N7IUQ5_9FIRM|nr:nucleotidyltransferase family protein [Desulfofundulus thermobenzoicus]MQL53239.1 NTP transferase domain-containing protein [Desulfofundulus thermobenzoicus]HHW44175.1 NTP transferase domain-containing protein [Desulfotomaculum sp.]